MSVWFRLFSFHVHHYLVTVKLIGYWHYRLAIEISLLFWRIYCTFKLRRSTVIKCSHVWRYISIINSNCQIFFYNNFRNMVVFSRFSLKMTNINICEVVRFSADYFVCQFCKRWYVCKICLLICSPYSNDHHSSIMLMVYQLLQLTLL